MGPTDSDGVSRVPPYLGSGRMARGFAHGAVTRRGPTFQTVAPAPRHHLRRPSTPADESAGLGIVRVRSPLLAESLLISSPRGTEMFHFPRYSLCGLFNSPADGAPARAGLLHSETHGSTVACTSPWTIAACRVLRRPLSPRHPSCARRACPPENHSGGKHPVRCNKLTLLLIPLTKCKNSILMTSRQCARAQLPVPRFQRARSDNQIQSKKWWAHLVSNQGPRPYQRRALNQLSYAPNSKAFLPKAIEKWWSRRESNPRHPACKAGALASELRPRDILWSL